jgi:hypothetical protein
MTNSLIAQQTASSLQGGYEHDLTVDDLAQVLPAHMKYAATQEFADCINDIVQDPDVAEQVRNNFVSYTSVLKDGRFKPEDYLNAVCYVSFKIMGHTNLESYKRTFPHRYQNLVARGATDKDISAYVSAYNKGKLVNLILEQTLVPSWVLNQSLYQKAINVQADIMSDEDNSAKVRSDAADSLMTHLKRPETQQVELNIGVQESDGMAELKDTLALLAEQQRGLIESGVTTKKIAHQKMGETIDVTPNEPE